VVEDRAVVGRRVEVDALARFLEELTDLSVAVVAGPAGMGKTTLWRRGVALARERGLRVLSAQPCEPEAGLSYVGLSDLLAGVETNRFGALPGVQRRALDIALSRAEPGEASIDARAVGSGLLSLLRDLVADGPLLLAVDDAHWLDRATSAALRYALRRSESLTLGVLATVRRDERSRRSFIESLPLESRLDLELAPLSVAAIHAILERRLGCSLPRPQLVKLVDACAGNPFFALEVARELQRLGGAAPLEGLPVPADLRVLVRSRLGRLPGETREALLAASCLGVPRTGLVDEQALGAAEEAGIVQVAEDGRIEFAHPLLAAAIRDGASTARRRAAHRRLAALVTETEERARHLALASSGPDAETARELEEAARLASARGAPGEAAELQELVLRLAPDEDAARSERLLAAAAFCFDAGDLARAEGLLEQATESANRRVRAQALRLLGQLHARRSSFPKAIETELAAREETAEGDELRAEIELDLAFYRFNIGDFAGADVHARAALPPARASGDEGLLASALAVKTVLGFLREGRIAERDLERALALDDPSREAPLPLRPRFVHGFLMLCTCRLDDALATLDTLRDEALEQGRESDVPFVYFYLVWAAVWRGDISRAIRYAEEAHRVTALLDDRVADALALSAGALAYAYAGEVERARRESAAATRHFELLGWLGGTIWPRWARGFLELSLGNAAATDEVLRPLSDMLGMLGPADPVLTMFLPDEIEALVQLGRAEEADTLLRPFEQRASALDRSWALAAAARCRALLHAASGDLDAALASLEQALAHHERAGLPFERARTVLELGRLQRRRRQKRLARLALEEADEAFRSLGMPLWAEQARAELARVATRRSPSHLSATEERVAKLAAEGLTNRAIAERAFVSVHTVEANLTRVYRKLGISSRAQIGRALDELAGTPIS
jgi:DNA-binding CsgD family transcriptional regulator